MNNNLLITSWYGMLVLQLNRGTQFNWVKFVAHLFTVAVFIYGGNVLALSPTEIQEFLDTHNTRRIAHGVAPLTWSITIASSAQNFANTCPRTHSDTVFGENLYWSSPAASPTTAVENWYSEVSLYDFNHPGFSNTTGHFTQIIWKNTTEIGCGIRTDCPTPSAWPLSYHVVCQYHPAGNFTNQFRQNVLPLKD
jgi:hypothetical protein